mgnify:FL=1
MQYGHFDLKNKEYVITRPDTPAPWVNYLGSPEYGAIISNNATGYSFAKSGANGRIIRHRFNSMSNDAPGRYIYLKDLHSGDYWSGSWAPVCKPLESYKSECRHGTGYTVISSEYDGIRTQTSYYVPLGKEYEVWYCRVTNNSPSARKIAVTGYCEFVNHSKFMSDLVDLQNSLFLTSTQFRGNYIYQSHRYEPGAPKAERFFGVAGGNVDAYCGDRDAFIGAYHGYENPVGIENGLKGQLNYNMNSCGALETHIELQAGESAELTYLLGQRTPEDAERIIAAYSDKSRVETEINGLKEYWHSRLNNLTVNTPDEKFNNMVNVWNAYNCFMTFTWSRAASFVYCGLRNGYGYRDTVQDIQGVIHLDPEAAREKIEFMLSAQVTSGAGLPLVKFDHNAGHEDTPDDESYVTATGHPNYRSDDALWLFPTVYKYISESGNTAFLDKQIVFAEKEETASVYEHLKRAIDFSVNNLGNHGMPAGLHADWNDGLRLGKRGESTFVAFQLMYAISIIKKYAEQKDDTDYIKYLDELGKKMGGLLNDCWDGDRWIRGYSEDGQTIGRHDSPEASMWLNPQSWSVISGFADEKQAELAMNSVKEKLATPYGAKLFDPPYDKHPFEGATGIYYYNNYVKENAGIFSQPQGWLILAETMLGHGNQAYEYWNAISPSSYNERAELRVLEPYVHGQFTEAAGSPFAGRSHVHWLTGTASTVMVATVEGILGIKPCAEGIVISPCIPSDWKTFEIRKIFRGKVLNVTVNNQNGAESGVKSVTVNGKKTDGVLIRETDLEKENQIIIEM